jgi:glycosyltransferase involved in cell wall biosynthesis
MKILHVSNTNINHDGRIKKEIETLRKSDLRLSVYGFGASQVEDSTRADYGLSDDEIITANLVSEHFSILPRALRYVFMLAEFTIKAVKHSISMKPDIVHCHDTFALPAGVMISFFGSKVIYDAHELESNKNGQSRALSLFTLLIEKTCWNRIAGFITVSTKILEWYQERFAEVQSATILNAPRKIYPDKPNNESDYLRNKFDIPENANVYVYVGILGEGRGIEKILAVFTRPGSSHIVFLGYGPFQEKIRSACPGNTRIHIHPAVPHDEVIKTISNANYGFCVIENSSLSDYLCLPNKLFEYAQANVVVIGSNFPEIASALDTYNLGFTVNDDEKSIGDLVDKLDNRGYEKNPGLLDELTWESQEIKLVDLYTKVLNSSK